MSAFGGFARASGAFGNAPSFVGFGGSSHAPDSTFTSAAANPFAGPAGFGGFAAPAGFGGFGAPSGLANQLGATNSQKRKETSEHAPANEEAKKTEYVAIKPEPFFYSKESKPEDSGEEMDQLMEDLLFKKLCQDALQRINRNISPQVTSDFAKSMGFGIAQWRAAISQGKRDDDDHFYSDSCHYSEYEDDEVTVE